MNNSIVVGLLQNTAILLALAMFYENFWLIDKNKKSLKIKLITGIILGGIGTILMFTPWILEPGMVFDTRSVMLSIAGLFFGAIPTLVAVIITSLVRFYIGGGGVFMGVAVIITSGLVGVLWRTYRPNWKNNKYYFELLAMGLVVHLTMIACTLFLQPDKILPTLKIITVPALFIYSPATMLIGSLMFKQSKNQDNRLAQLKLIETERRLNYVLEGGNIITLFLNTKGDIEYCNDYLLQITGYTKEEVLNKNWFELFIPKNINQNILEIFNTTIQTGIATKNFENIILSKNKEELNILWNNITLKSDDGKIIGIACVGVDTTESKLYKKELIKKNEKILIQNKELIVAKEKAEESERLKSAFLANMSHEIRTPMNSILGFSDLLMNDNLSISKKEKYHQIVNSSGKRLMNLISDIIDISKIEAKQLTLEHRLFNLNSLIDTLHGQFSISASQRNVVLKKAKALNNAKSFINCDETRLSQVISNLLENAFKFTKDGTIEFGYVLAENNIHFYVKDSGIGINKKDHQLIFDRFKQSDNEQLTVKAGSGLGLSISKGIVEILGGHIWVESELNKGATFHFTIPNLFLNIPDQEILKPENKLELESNPSVTLLIAEDELSNYLYLEALLEPYQFNLIQVENGIDAVEKIKTNNAINLILMDINMPIMSGIVATKEIRKFNKTIPIIALTAYAMTEDRDRAFAVGCTDYLSKPISKDILVESIMKALK